MKRSYRMGGVHTSILTRLANGFEQLAAQLSSRAPIQIGGFTQACYLVSPVIQHLGIAMNRADEEYSAKVRVIVAAGNLGSPLKDLLDREIQQNTFMLDSSASRSLIRVTRSLTMLKIIFERVMMTPSENSLVGPVNTAYNQVFAPYHGWEVIGAFELALPLLPTRSQFFEAVNLDEASAFVQIQRTVNALVPLIQYINNLFHSRRPVQGLLSMI